MRKIDSDIGYPVLNLFPKIPPTFEIAGYHNHNFLQHCTAEQILKANIAKITPLRAVVLWALGPGPMPLLARPSSKRKGHLAFNANKPFLEVCFGRLAPW